MSGIGDTSPVVVWFRRDLRIDDQPALSAAAATGRPVIPCFVWAPEEEAPWAPGAASRWWLHQSLEQLSRSLATLGLRLILRSGSSSLAALQQLVQETGAGAVYWNRLYEPALVRRDKGIKATLQQAGLEVQSFPGHLLHEPWAIENQQGRPYQVFTPFYRAVQELGGPTTPCSRPSGVPPPPRWPVSLELGALNLLPAIDWAGGLRDTWTPGEAGAIEALKIFAERPVTAYKEQRDIPGVQGTSRMSPALHFGEISARRIWQICQINPAAEPYLRQLVWRDFAHHLLYHFPHTSEQPLREEFNHFPWRKNTRDLQAWARGQTGYPIVDAGMRELWATGWMHNRVRMIVASFLVKDLRLHWMEGARWFWDTLVDADLANNTLGWQWAAGCGADAAPYFRIFNPDLQSRKFDPEGRYIQRWVPELADLAPKALHDAAALPQTSGCPDTYPPPMVDHRKARDEALTAFAQLRQSA